jgi:hypothetical protein
LTTPTSGWFVDIEHNSSITALNHQMGELVSASGIPRLTRAHLTGDDRQLTTQAKVQKTFGLRIM